LLGCCGSAVPPCPLECFAFHAAFLPRIPSCITIDSNLVSSQRRQGTCIYEVTESSVRLERYISPAGASVPDCLVLVGTWNHLCGLSERFFQRLHLFLIAWFWWEYGIIWAARAKDLSCGCCLPQRRHGGRRSICESKEEAAEAKPWTACEACPRESVLSEQSRPDDWIKRTRERVS